MSGSCHCKVQDRSSGACKGTLAFEGQVGRVDLLLAKIASEGAVLVALGVNGHYSPGIGAADRIVREGE